MQSHFCWLHHYYMNMVSTLILKYALHTFYMWHILVVLIYILKILQYSRTSD